MTPILRVQKSHSIADIERLLGELESHETADLLINLELRDWQFGGIASIIQLLLTWSKHNPASRLITHIQDTSRARTQLRNLSQTDHGLLALMLASDVVTANKRTSVANEADQFVQTRLQDMNARRSTGGTDRLLLCADHINHYLPQFYYYATGDPTPKLKPEGEFSDLMQTLISEMIGVHYHANSFPPEFTSALGSILYELFSNTNRWALKEWDMMPIERSVRGVRLQTVRGGKKDLLSRVENNPPLAEYISALPMSTVQEHVLLEISIFDAGSGLAAQWLKSELTKDISLERERKAVIKCLHKHATSQPKSHHGLGLYLVMQQMQSVKGFIRVRTGRLNLYRDFIKHPFDVSEEQAHNDASYDLLDWTTGTRTPSGCAHAEGTLFSMLIPLRLGHI